MESLEPVTAFDALGALALQSGKVRRAVYALRRALRPIQRKRIAGCGYFAEGDGRVAVVKGEHSCSFKGLRRCGSTWECPGCHGVICRRRAAEVKHAAELHGLDRLAMATFTIRHGAGDDLKELRSKLTRCWQAMVRGAPWRRFALSLNTWWTPGEAPYDDDGHDLPGLIGFIRALEVTHGANGYHPHLHVLLFLRDPILPTDLHALERSDGSTIDSWLPGNAWGWLFDRWCRIVERELGPEYVPDSDHGLVLGPARSAEYLCKLGLELADPSAKVAKNGNRTPWQIGQSWKDEHNARDEQLWRGYCEAMRGAKSLTWSRGLKKRFGIRPRRDPELAEEETAADPLVLATLGPDAWGLIRDQWTSTAQPVSYAILMAAELGAVGDVLRRLRLVQDAEGVWRRRPRL